MTNYALLVGSQTYGLTGCNSDVQLMKTTLEKRGFDKIEVRIDADATRQGILDGLQAMVANVRAGDAAVFYYSGHGGRVARIDMDDRKANGLSPYHQFIVPFDMTDSEQGDFRGLLSEELTDYQRRLTDAFAKHGAIPNATTILDCCHSGYMARGSDARKKAVEFPKMFRTLGMRQHAEQLSKLAPSAGLMTNADVVRLVACQPDQSAFEAPSARGEVHGALTDALVSVLDELGTAAASWAIVGDLIRRRVAAAHPEQRPEIEGPTERMIFSAESLPQSHAYPIAMRKDPSTDAVKATIEAAELLSIAVGDEFELMTPGTEQAVGTAVVSGLDQGSALLTISPPEAELAVRESAIAVPRKISLSKLLVFVDIGDEGTAELTEAIGGGTRLGVSALSTDVIATVTRDANGLVLNDSYGARWRTNSFSNDSSGRSALVSQLERIAKGQRLLDLESGRGASTLDHPIKITFSAVKSAQPVELELHGAELSVGEEFEISIHNLGPTPLYAWLLNVGFSGRSSHVLYESKASGLQLGAQGSENDATERLGKLVANWPADVPIEPSGRIEHLIVVLADRQSDLSQLADSGQTSRGESSELDSVLAEASTGMRDVAVAQSSLRYRLEHIDFRVLPQPS